LQHHVPAALALLAFSTAAIADSPPATDLGTVVVTATRNAQSAGQSLAEVTVITRDDIDRLQPQTVQALLDGLPGIATSNSGGPGELTSVFMRGASASQLLVLVDGIKVGDATSGLPRIEQIPVEQIQRIEIVRGPRSSLYGSDAFSVGGGTYDTWQGQGGLSGGNSHAWYAASVSGYQTAGINACRGVGAPVYAGCFTNEPDKDGYWNSAGSLRGGFRFDNGAEVTADWLRVYGHNHYDGAPYNNENRNVQQILGGTLTLPRIGPWQAAFTLGQAVDQETDTGGPTSGLFNTLRNTASWMNDLRLTQGQHVSTGVDYLKDHVYSNTAYTGTSREDYGAYAQYQGNFGAHEVQLSLRDDLNQQFGFHWTGAAAWGYAFNRDLRLIASFGTAFRAPTFNDLYYPESYGYQTANPDLRPEKSGSAEIGLHGTPGAWHWSLHAYQTQVRDMITLDAQYVPANASHARLRGIDGQIDTHWRNWRGALYVSDLDARDRSEGQSNHLLARRPAQSARLDVDHRSGRLDLGATVNAAGRRYDDAANTHKLGGYATVDLRASWQLRDDWQLQAHLANLLDKHYETVEYYNQPGRALYLTLRYAPATR
jgi:vitamin B12 transporter